MRVTSLQDIKYLSQAAGTDMIDPYDMHAVCVGDGDVEGTWKSYEQPIDISLWSTGKPEAAGDTLDCAVVAIESGNDQATDRYRLIDVDCTEQRPFICERPRTAENTGTGWTYAQQDTCNHWIDCNDGRLTMVDQETGPLDYKRL